MVKICAAKTQNSDFKSAQKSLVWPWAIFTVFHCFSGCCFWHMFYDPENGHFGDQFGPIKCHFLRSWVHTHNVWYGMYILMDQGPIAHDSILILIPFAPLCGVPHDPILGDPGSSFWTSEIWPKNGQKPCSKNTKQCFQKCSKVLSLALRRFRTCVCFYMILDPKNGHFGGQNGRFWSVLSTHGTHFHDLTGCPHMCHMNRIRHQYPLCRTSGMSQCDTTWHYMMGCSGSWKSLKNHVFSLFFHGFDPFFHVFQVLKNPKTEIQWKSVKLQWRTFEHFCTHQNRVFAPLKTRFLDPLGSYPGPHFGHPFSTPFWTPVLRVPKWTFPRCPLYWPWLQTHGFYRPNHGHVLYPKITQKRHFLRRYFLCIFEKNEENVQFCVYPDIRRSENDMWNRDKYHAPNVSIFGTPKTTTFRPYRHMFHMVSDGYLDV